MSSINILIVEDEFIIAEDISETLQHLNYNVIGNVRTFAGAIEVLETQSVDIALVDINIGEQKDGIDLAEIIRETYKIPFIFITSHADKTTVERAKQQRPNGYLVKPFDKKDLYTCIEIALANFIKTDDETSSNKDSIFIKDGNVFVKLKFDSILLVKSEGNYVSIQTEQKKHLIRKSLKEMGSLLPPEQFFQVHKSFIINTEYIDSVTSTDVLLKQHEVPIGRDYKEQFLKKIKIT